MSNNKQSSIEWIVNFFESGVTSRQEWLFAKQQAKAMHKQEIIDAVDGFPLENRNMSGEDYYEKTYGGNNE